MAIYYLLKGVKKCQLGVTHKDVETESPFKFKNEQNMFASAHVKCKVTLEPVPVFF